MPAGRSLLQEATGWLATNAGVNFFPMCGRFTQRFTWQEVRDFLDLGGPARNLAPRYNLAPSQDAAVARAEESGRTLSMLRWGLVPAWSRDPKIGYKLINARSETAHAKPSFRAAFRSQRCLIPVDGFYEWSQRGAARQAWLIEPLDGGIMALAGLWERWIVRDRILAPKSLAHLNPGSTLESFTVLTRAADDSLAAIHHRMPVVIPPDEFNAWLHAEPVALDQLPVKPMSIHPVSNRVNKPSNDDALCVEPIRLLQDNTG